MAKRKVFVKETVDREILGTLDAMTLSDLVIWAADKLNECKSRGFSEAHFSLDDNCMEGHVELDLIGEREETDKEYNTRLEKEKKERQKKNEIRQEKRNKQYEDYLKLKKKFEKAVSDDE